MSRRLLTIKTINFLLRSPAEQQAKVQTGKIVAFNHLPLPANRQSPDGMVAKMVAEHQTSYFLRIVQFSRNFGCGWVGGVGKRGEDG